MVANLTGIEDIVRALRPAAVAVADPAERAALARQMDKALRSHGLRVLVMRCPCPTAQS